MREEYRLGIKEDHGATWAATHDRLERDGTMLGKPARNLSGVACGSIATGVSISVGHYSDGWGFLSWMKWEGWAVLKPPNAEDVARRFLRRQRAAPSNATSRLIVHFRRRTIPLINTREETTHGM
jgi:hypothetical protein